VEHITLYWLVTSTQQLSQSKILCFHPGAEQWRGGQIKLKLIGLPLASVCWPPRSSTVWGWVADSHEMVNQPHLFCNSKYFGLGYDKGGLVFWTTGRIWFGNLTAGQIGSRWESLFM